MRILAMSDSHGRSLDELVRKEEFDLLMFLGDMDDVTSIRSIREVMELQQTYGEKMIVVPGNHDHAIYAGVVVSFNRTKDIESNNRILTELRRQLEADMEVSAYLERLIQLHSVAISLDNARFGDRFHTLVIHGALDGNLRTYPDAEGPVAELWYRLESEEDHVKNFARMRERGFNVMMRGHDRVPEFAQQKNGNIVITKNPAEVLLDPHALQTITVGSYANGHYVLINTNPFSREYPLVQFKRL